MAKFKVLKNFKDKEQGQSYQVGDEIDITVKRSEEIESNAKQLGIDGPFLERLKEKK